MKWCRCYEGQRVEVWGCQGPSHTGLSIILYIDSTEEVVTLFEVELQKPRNLKTHESEECEYGVGVGVYTTLLQSDTVQSYGRTEAGTRTVGFNCGVCLFDTVNFFIYYNGEDES